MKDRSKRRHNEIGWFCANPVGGIGATTIVVGFTTACRGRDIYCFIESSAPPRRHITFMAPQVVSMRSTPAAVWPMTCKVSGMQHSRRTDDFCYYMHDGSRAFRFALEGTISDDGARDLEQAWHTASSMVADRFFIVDLSRVTGIDSVGQDLIRRWHRDGAQLVGESPQAGVLIAADDEGVEVGGLHPSADVFVAAIDFSLTWQSDLGG